MRNRKIQSGVLAFVLVFALISNEYNSNAINNLQSKVANTSNPALEGAFLISKPKNRVILAKYKNAHSLTDIQLVELLKAVGFKGDGLITAWAVAKTESNGRPFAFNGNEKTGDSSFGVFQINMIGDLGPDRRDKYNLMYDAELFSPVKNAQVVFQMTDGGKNWSSWKHAKSPKILKWKSKFPKNLHK